MQEFGLFYGHDTLNSLHQTATYIMACIDVGTVDTVKGVAKNCMKM